MPELPDREQLDEAMATVLATELDRQKQRLLALLGDPPDLRQVPSAFWRQLAEGVTATLRHDLQESYLTAAREQAILFGKLPDDRALTARAMEWAQDHLDDTVRGFVARSREMVADQVREYHDQQKKRSAELAALLLLVDPNRQSVLSQTDLTETPHHEPLEPEDFGTPAIRRPWEDLLEDRLGGELKPADRDYLAARNSAEADRRDYLGRYMDVPFGQSRALAVTITSNTRANVAGERQVVRDFGRMYPNVQVVAVWRAWRGGGSPVCDRCEDLDGLPEGQWGAEAALGPPLHPSCRCGLEWIPTFGNIELSYQNQLLGSIAKQLAQFRDMIRAQGKCHARVHKSLPTPDEPSPLAEHYLRPLAGFDAAIDRLPPNLADTITRAFPQALRVSHLMLSAGGRDLWRQQGQLVPMELVPELRDRLWTEAQHGLSKDVPASPPLVTAATIAALERVWSHLQPGQTPPTLPVVPLQAPGQPPLVTAIDVELLERLWDRLGERIGAGPATKAYDPGEERDDHGRWSGEGGAGGAGSPKPDKPEPSPGEGPTHAHQPRAPGMDQLFARISQPDGGFTYQPGTHDMPSTGCALSIYPDRSFAKPAAEMSVLDLDDYIDRNQDLFDNTSNYLGAWHDPETGKVFLDVSRVVHDPAEAHRLCLKHDQIAYFDLAAGQSVTVNRDATSGGQATKGFGKNHVREQRNQQADPAPGGWSSDSGPAGGAGRETLRPQADGRGNGRAAPAGSGAPAQPSATVAAKSALGMSGGIGGDGGFLPTGTTIDGQLLDKAAPVHSTLAGGNGHRFSSTQFNLPADIARRVLALAREIPDEDLRDHGRELEPHVTVRFGLWTNEADDLWPIVSRFGPIMLQLGAASIFSRPADDETDGYDVVKFEVTSPDLVALHAALGALEHTDTHPTYQPHVTVAYVAPGTGQEFADYFNAIDNLAGAVLTVDQLIFSPAKGGSRYVFLLHEQEPLRKGASIRKDGPDDEQRGSDGKWTSGGGGGGSSAADNPQHDQNLKQADELKRQDWKQHGVHSQAFKGWFGDWENNPAGSSKVVEKSGGPATNSAAELSKVVDDKGQPQVVFHGTDAEFQAFSEGKTSEGLYGPGFYFAQDKDMAERKGLPAQYDQHAKKVLSLYLNIRKPFDATATKPLSQWLSDFKGSLGEEDAKRIAGFTAADWSHPSAPFANPDRNCNGREFYEALAGVGGKASDANALLKKAGYDGIKEEGTQENTDFGRVCWVAFHPNQIKSTANEGAFSLHDPTITKSAGSHGAQPSRFVETDPARFMELLPATAAKSIRKDGPPDEQRASDGKWSSGGGSNSSADLTPSGRERAQHEQTEPYKQWAKSISPEEKEAILDFKGGNYHAIREAEVNPNAADSQYAQEAQQLNAALDRAPKFNGQVYRGLRPSQYPSAKQFIDSCQPGAIVTMKATTSTSTDPTVALDFAAQEGNQPECLFRIKSESGVSIANLGAAREEEVALRKGAQYRVAAVLHDVTIKPPHASTSPSEAHAEGSDPMTIKTLITLEEVPHPKQQA